MKTPLRKKIVAADGRQAKINLVDGDDVVVASWISRRDDLATSRERRATEICVTISRSNLDGLIHAANYGAKVGWKDIATLEPGTPDFEIAENVKNASGDRDPFGG